MDTSILTGVIRVFGFFSLILSIAVVLFLSGGLALGTLLTAWPPVVAGVGIALIRRPTDWRVPIAASVLLPATTVLALWVASGSTAGNENAAALFAVYSGALAVGTAAGAYRAHGFRVPSASRDIGAR